MPSGATLQGYSTVPATSDAKEYLRLLLKHKLGLLSMVILGILLALLYLVSTKPVYQASALLEVKEAENPTIGDSRMAPVDFNKPTVKEEANILKSHKVLAPVVELYNLNREIKTHRIPVIADLTQYFPAVGDWLSKFSFAQRFAWGDETLEIAGLEVPSEWEDKGMVLTSMGDGYYNLSIDNRIVIENAETGAAQTVNLAPLNPLRIVVTRLEAAAGVEFTVTKKSLQESLRQIQNDLQTETSDLKSRMIRVSLRGEDSARTTEILNAIAEKYRDVKLGSESRVLQQELKFFEEAAPKVKQDLEEAEAALQRYRNQTNIIDQSTQVKAKLAQLDKLESDMIELQLEKNELKERYSDIHPSTKKLDKKILVLQNQISVLKRQVGTAPNTERQLKTLEEREEAARTLFNETNQKLQKIRLIAVAQVGSVTIWDKALAPKKPVSPKAMLAFVGGTVTTLFLYIVFLTMRSALSTVITDQESLERASGLPVFINIPRSPAQKRLANNAQINPRRLLPGSSDSAEVPSANILAVQKPEDYSVENMRGLRLMLEDVMDGAPNNVVMICSPLPNMGKSFVSANLAVLLAQSGKRVLLLDADYQRGQIHKSLGLPMGPGLPEVVAGKSELKETVKATSVPNLYCIPRGFISGGASRETPGNKEFGAFLHVVAPRFDMVILDTPPVLSVSTAATLGKHAGSTFMVVKEGEIKEPQVTEALKRLSFSGVRVNGCLMNSSSQPTPSHYAYYRETVE